VVRELEERHVQLSPGLGETELGEVPHRAGQGRERPGDPLHFERREPEADARAYAALMRHVREVDSATRTVVMIQMENEVGLLGDTRGPVQAGQRGVRRPVPKELMDYLEKNKSTLLPETQKLWDSAGGKTSGSWEEVFGKGPGADEAFMAWHYARYMNRVTEAGKKEYPLPVYVNAWLRPTEDKQPGDYPSAVRRPTTTTSGGPARRRSTSWLRTST